MQAMAAAMLPFVWPSFQLTSGASERVQLAANNQKLRARSLDRSTMAPAMWPTMDYTQVNRGPSAGSNKTAGQSPAAASEFRPTIVSMDAPLASSTTSTTTTTTTPRPPETTPGKPAKAPTRKKRRKPSYLQRQAALLNQQRRSEQPGTANNQPHGTGEPPAVPPPYPDSTRMASRYPMPRIKFNPVGVPVVAATAANQTAASTTIVSPKISVKATTVELLQQQPQRQNKLPEGRLMQPIGQVPKSLSKLIEQQLQTLNLNATSLLNSINSTLAGSSSLAAVELMMKTGQAAKFLAPTTSVSKVVRLPSNSTSRDGHARVQVISLPVQSSSGASKSHFPLDFERLNSTKASKPQQTTTTTTTTTTARPPEPATQVPSRTESPTTTTTTLATTTIAGQVQSTEASGLRHSLEAPTSLPAQRGASNSSTSSPVVATTQGARGDKKPAVEVENEEATSTTTTTTGKPRKFGQQQPQPQRQLSLQTIHQRQSTSNNIKLFHFKRKPDMNKLPFYKKPLNFSDFNGWTSEQIQEHLLELANSNANDESPAQTNNQQDDHNNNDDNDADDERAAPAEGDESSSSSSSSSSPPSSASSAATTGRQAKGKRRKMSSATLTDAQLIESPQESSFIETTSGAGQERLQSLLKRKRRAKNQFERLLAELQAAAAASASATSTPASPPVASPAVVLVNVPSVVEPASSLNERVPVMRKKLEPLVMKPMFFVMNQKRRSQGGSQTSSSSSPPPVSSPLTTSTQAPPPTTTTSTPAPSVLATLPTTTMTTTTASNRSLSIQTTNSSETLKLMGESLEHLKSKPIIRMRRKHHGDQPIQLFGAPGGLSEASHWRPSRPIWSPLVRLPSDKLMLVPSGLLTPSGSHLMPFYAPEGGPLRPVMDAAQLAPAKQEEPLWRPTGNAAHPRQVQKPQVDQILQETFLVSPSAPAVSTGHQAGPQMTPMLPVTIVATSADLQQQTGANLQPKEAQQPGQVSQQSAMSGSSELRVPKLLVKPMRPAKYSLNGYIPKPSLANNAASQPATLRTTNSANSQQTRQPPGAMRKPNGSSPAMTRPLIFNGPAGQSVVVGAGKDLDSSTSNEIFSRRRGLQQHQRSIQSKAQLSFDSLVQTGSSYSSSSSSQVTTASNQTAANSLQLNPMQKRQLMEENKRRYVQLHQAAASVRSPTLSLQKANQIKAKLGLQASAGPSSSSSGRRRSSSEDSETSAWRTTTTTSNDDNNQPQQASTSSISTAEFPGSLSSSSSSSSLRADHGGHDDDNNRQQDQLNDLAGQSNGRQLIGAPLSAIPKTDFECTDKKGRFVSGLFADHKTGCQVWHLCSNNRKYSFLCPSGTIFNAKVRICDWRYNVKCENTSPF